MTPTPATSVTSATGVDGVSEDSPQQTDAHSAAASTGALSLTPAKTKRRRYVGEEAERVTLKDCAAANELAAKMLAGQIDPMSIVVEAPKRVCAIVTEGQHHD
jgi:hypothetical protein